MTLDLERTVPVDQDARDRIRTDTASTLFVEAGAGSGKTTALVERVYALVARDGIPLSRIAAVTFTEKAGAELRDRLRTRFELYGTNPDPLIRERVERALDDLDGAAFGTLHSFALRILAMFPIQAGLPPRVEILDEVASSVASEARWSALRRELLDDPELSETILVALGAGARLETFRSLARAFANDWDLIAERVTSHPRTIGRWPSLDDLGRRAHELVAQRRDCRDPSDRFLDRLAALDEWATEFDRAVSLPDRIAVTSAMAALKWGYGRGDNWPDLAGLKSECQALQELARERLVAVADAALRPLAQWIAERVEREARARLADGRLEFHDALVAARDLVRTRPDVRARLQAEFPRILLDEFQDTDPIQIEIAVRIAGGAGADADDWRDIEIPAGSLFVVGDPKQSIYRFRRASIATYLDAQAHVGETVALTTNFRTTEPILDWVNGVFGQLIEPVPEGQPEYRALSPHRDDELAGPPVTVVGTREHDDRPYADELRDREATDVAAVISRALGDPWTIVDERTGERRPVRPGDIAILIPSRTSLPQLERALNDLNIPYRAESSSLVYRAEEVRAVMAALRAIADPSDRLSCVTALRSTLFAVGDDELWRYTRGAGVFDVRVPVPEGLEESEAGRAMAWLQHLYRRARWLTPSELLTELVVERRVLEVAMMRPKARDQWRRLRFVIDQARAWSDAEGGGLRDYLAWAAAQAGETVRVSEAVLPERDLDVVKVMTIHAAKGLEFPVVALSGMTTAPRVDRGVRLIWTKDDFAVRLTSSLQTTDFELAQPVDEQMDSLERRRLLYVGATRARDHLIVSLHRGGRSSNTNAHLLAGVQSWEGASDWSGADPAALRTPSTDTSSAVETWTEWESRTGAARARSDAAWARSASGYEGTEPEVALPFEPLTEEEQGRAKGARDLDAPAWAKGRYGNLIGRAVHAVLQSIPFDDPSAVDVLSASAALAEGVSEHADEVAALVRSALASEPVQRAATRRHWRESFVGTVEDDGVVLEGFVDLIYEEDDGSLVIVDYKTDAVPLAAIPARAAFYAPQVEAYRRAVASASDAGVRAALAFLNSENASAWLAAEQAGNAQSAAQEYGSKFSERGSG